MNSFYLAFTVVFPLFCMMALGYFLRTVGVFNEDFLKQLNQLCFQVFLPLVLFVNIYNSDFKSLFSLRLIIFAVIGILISFIFLMGIVPIFEKKRRNCGVIVQGVFRSNFILFGIPVSASLYGAENTSVTAILLAFIIPLFNLLSILALETFSGEKSSGTVILKKVFQNPLIISSIFAFIFVLTGIRLPMLLEGTISDLAKVATPMALVVLGGSFQFKNLGKDMGALVFSICGKLLMMPLFLIPLAVLLGFRGMELTALLSMLASPTAVSTFTMAQSAKANDVLAGQIVVLDSLFAVGTIFLWISLLKYIELI